MMIDWLSRLHSPISIIDVCVMKLIESINFRRERRGVVGCCRHRAVEGDDQVSSECAAPDDDDDDSGGGGDGGSDER